MLVTQNRLFLRHWMFLLGLILLPVLPISGFAAEIQVPSQFPTIQAAIDGSQGGDVIIVQPGTYTENINFNGKAITLASTNPLDPTIVANTIIDGSMSGSVVTFDSSETPNSVLTGFTIRNGNGTLIEGKRYGGGIYCGLHATPTIRHNKIVNNTADMGGAIFIYGNSPPTITDGPNVDYPYVGKSQMVGLSVTATDPDNDDLIYRWVPREGGTITGTGNTVSFSAAIGGVYHIDLTVDDQHGGKATGVVTVTVIGVVIQTPMPQLKVGQSASISATVTPPVANSPEYPVSITWSVTEGPAAGAFDPAVNGTPGATSITFTPSAAGPGRIQAVYKVGAVSTIHSVTIALNPIVLSIEPAVGIQNTTVQAVLIGNNFARVSTVSLSGSGVTTTIRAGRTETSLPVQFVISKEAAPGNRNIILTTPEGNFTSPVTFQIKALPPITANPASLNLTVGDMANITFSIPDPAPAGGLNLVITNTGAMVATVPASAIIPEGQTSVGVNVSAIGYGTTTVTADAQDHSKVQVPITVINPPLITFSPPQISIASTLVERCTITISNPAPTGGLAVTLTGGEGKVEIPATVTIPQSQTSAIFNVKGLIEGATIITASASGYPSANLQVNVIPAQLTLFPSTLPIAQGRSSALSLTLQNYAPAGGLTVNLVSSNTAFATVPATATIPQGEKSVSVPVNGVTIGTATVTASLAGFQSAQATVNVLQAFNISFIPSSLSITPGTNKTADVVVSSLAPEGGLTITLSNPSPEKITVPTSVFIPAGKYNSTITVSGLDSTSSPVMVNASCPGLTDGQLSVTVYPKYEPWIKADVTVGAGLRSNGAVGLTGMAAPTGGYTINLAASDPLVATVVPATVTLPEGSTYAIFKILGKAVGIAEITASVAGISSTNTVNVVRPTFQFGSVPTSIAFGTTATAIAWTNVPNGTDYYDSINGYKGTKYNNTYQSVDQSVTITLSSQNAAAIVVQETTVIQAGSYGTNFTLQAVGPGTSTITASASNWDSKTTDLITAGSPWFGADITVGVGCRSTGAVGLTGGTAPAGGYVVNLISSNPSIATVPPTVTIPQGSSSATFTIVGKAEGTTGIVASAAGFSATSTVTVVKPTFQWGNIQTQMTLSGTYGNTQVYPYVPNGSYYSSNSKVNSTSQAVDETVTINLSSENPAVIQVSATITIAMGTSYSSYASVQAVGTGSSTITASAPGWGSITSGTITVVGPWLGADITIGAGCRSNGVVRMLNGNAPAGGFTVNLASSDPSVATVPSAVTISQGSSYYTFSIVGKAVGTAEITATASGFSATNTVTVVKPTFQWSSVPTQTTVGITNSVSVLTNVPNGSAYSSSGTKNSSTTQSIDSTVTIGLSSENPSVIQVPATATLTAGSNKANFSVQAVGIGSSTITASASGWDPQISPAIPVVGPYIKTDIIVGTGCRSTGVVGLTGVNAPTGGYTINLASSNPLVATVPATVTIPQYYNYANFTIVGKGEGTAEITASRDGFSITSTVTVVRSTFNWNAPTQMTLGTTNSISMSTSVPNGSYYSSSNKLNNVNQAVDQSLAVNLSAESPSVIQVPATATIAAGSYSTSFSIQAVGAGSSTITASASGWNNLTSETITVGGVQVANVTVGAGCRYTGSVVITGGAPAGGYTVTLSSNNPSVATVPASVTIPQYSTYASFTIAGKSVGTAEITATIAGIPTTGIVTVVKPTFQLSSVPTQMAWGAAANISIAAYVPNGTSTNQVVDQALAVSLMSDNPGVIQVPGTVTIPAGSNSQSLIINAVGPGSSRITASAPGWDSKTSGVVAVTGAFLGVDVTVGFGCRSTGVVNLFGGYAPAGGITFNLTISDPSIAAIPATVTIPQGSGSVSFNIGGRSVGSADITASAAAGYVMTNTVTVVRPAFQVSAYPTNVWLGTTTTISAYTSVPEGSYYSGSSKYSNEQQVVDQVFSISLSSENASVLNVPTTTTFAAGSNNQSIPVQAVGPGSSTVTVSAPGWDADTSDRVIVIAPSVKADIKVGAGCQSTGRVELTVGTAPSGGYTINLTSSDPSIATVPATVTIPQYSYSANFTILGKAEGATEILATVAGVSTSSTVTVVKPTFRWSSLTEITVGTTRSISVYTYVPEGSSYSSGSKSSSTNQVAEQLVTVSLSSDSPTIIQVPATATIPAGGSSASFSIQAVGVGSGTITASAPGWDSKTSGTITTIGPVLLADVTVGAGCRSTGAVRLTSGTTPSGGYTVNLTSNDPSVVSVPATVTIPQGYSYTTFNIVGVNPGTTQIVVSIGGYSGTSTVTVVKPNLVWSAVPTEIAMGATASVGLHSYVPNGSGYYIGEGMLYRSENLYQNVDQAVTVTLSSENPSVVQVPATVTIEAGSGNIGFSIQAVGTGTSIITASATGWDSATSGTITVP